MNPPLAHMNPPLDPPLCAMRATVRLVQRAPGGG
jgi:hypothetical protein